MCIANSTLHVAMHNYSFCRHSTTTDHSSSNLSASNASRSGTTTSTQSQLVSVASYIHTYIATYIYSYIHIQYLSTIFGYVRMLCNYCPAAIIIHIRIFVVHFIVVISLLCYDSKV